MLRKNVRQRKDYLFKKALEERQKTTFEKKKLLKDALDNNKAIPTEIRGEERKLRKKLDLTDDVTEIQRTHMDDEYAYVGSKDPRVLITTARDPSKRLTQFLKEMRLIFPEAQRVNRGSYVLKDLLDLARKHEMTDVMLIHEHRGNPDGLTVCHMPHGPTAYFTLHDVVMRHDLQERAPKMSEAKPHLIFSEFDSKLGRRVKSILQALFPVPSPLSQRVMTFANVNDTIHFRHHTWSDEREEAKEGEAPRKKPKTVLSECGPRFAMTLYRIELGTLDMKDVKTEWVLRPNFNRQRTALGKIDEDGA